MLKRKIFRILMLNKKFYIGGSFIWKLKRERKSPSSVQVM